MVGFCRLSATFCVGSFKEVGGESSKSNEGTLEQRGGCMGGCGSGGGVVSKNRGDWKQKGGDEGVSKVREERRVVGT